jgi:hypothetical protein
VTDVPQGYLPPPSAYAPAAPVGPDPHDPLVNPQFAGINGWFNRVSGMLKRSWKSLAAIFAITYVIPAIGLTLIGVAAQFLFLARLLKGLPNQPVVREEPDLAVAVGLPLVALTIALVALAFVFLQAAGYAAATYAATHQAIGREVRLGEALGYGFRRCIGLAGWQLVVGLILIGGFIACILPGIYFYAATALFGPIYLFERRRPIGRSFSIFNNNLGRVLGRLALILCVAIGAGVLNAIFGVIGQVATGSLGSTTIDFATTMASQTIASVLGIVVALPVAMITFAGILLTYTEQRGFEGPVNSATLAAEL